jgi:hypothetical protein
MHCTAWQVGLLVATCELDVSLLLQGFDVGPFDGFLTPEVYEGCEAAARHAAAEKVHRQQHQQQQEQDSADGADPALVSAAAEPSAEQVRRELVPLLVEALAKQQQVQQHAQRKQQKRAAAAGPSEEAVAPAHSLAAITMLCMLPGYEARAVELMPLLFEELPVKVRTDLCREAACTCGAPC